MPLEDRRQLTPLVYIPEGTSIPQGPHPPMAPKEETYTPKEQNTKSSLKRETLHASHASVTQSNRKNKIFSNKHKTLRPDKSTYKIRGARNQKSRGEREKRKFEAKIKRKHFEDARECINRNRTIRESERQVRISHRSKSQGSPTLEGGRSPRPNRSPREDRSPKRVVVKKEQSPSSDEERQMNIDRLALKMEPINGDPGSECETYMFIEEAN